LKWDFLSGELYAQLPTMSKQESGVWVVGSRVFPRDQILGGHGFSRAEKLSKIMSTVAQIIVDGFDSIFLNEESQIRIC
jgi:hypothetical protein